MAEDFLFNECRWCSHLEKEEDGNFGESIYFWYECRVSFFDNLSTFPFKHTICSKFEKRRKYVGLNFTEKLTGFLKKSKKSN